MAVASIRFSVLALALMSLAVSSFAQGPAAAPSKPPATAPVKPPAPAPLTPPAAAPLPLDAPAAPIEASRHGPREAPRRRPRQTPGHLPRLHAAVTRPRSEDPRRIPSRPADLREPLRVARVHAGVGVNPPCDFSHHASRG
ncbi:hypothetical protein C4D60_Mb01t24400 [Musa balbisiana]|uniref:Uncharacterized protein n=1 Tax=Musa balbisiana TaxID=52838 RepID=A0A4S8JPT2_MUSBA|nr:hypothetical protein C4D60_Mb01t24400 [Musa balbisiana]